MTLRQHQDTPCWQILDHATNLPPGWGELEMFPHYGSRAECESAIDGRDVGYEQPGQMFSAPCIALVCDGCGDVFDAGEGVTHFEGEHDAQALSDGVWTATDQGRHFCPECDPEDG